MGKLKTLSRAVVIGYVIVGVAMGGLVLWGVLHGNATENYDTFLSSAIGTAVGSIAAIAGAVVVWLHQREHQQRIDRMSRSFAALSAIQRLSHRSLEASKHRLAPDREGQERELRDIAVMMEAWLPGIPDKELVAELRFALDLMDENQALAHFVASYYWRAKFVREWLDNLVANDGSRTWLDCRPAEYEKFKTEFDKYEDYRREEREEWEWSARQRDLSAKEAAAAGEPERQELLRPEHAQPPEGTVPQKPLKRSESQDPQQEL